LDTLIETAKGEMRGQLCFLDFWGRGSTVFLFNF
jgi:hypothetical protein